MQSQEIQEKAPRQSEGQAETVQGALIWGDGSVPVN